MSNNSILRYNKDMANKYSVKLLRKKNIAKDTWLFAFSAKGRSASGTEELIKFIPGQYMTYALTLPNGKTDWRDFTITSFPGENELWLVTKIKKDPSGFKKILFGLPINSNISLEGPSGGFTIEKETKPLVFIAGGIGINVFYSIVKHVSNTKRKNKIFLLASFSTKEEIIFYDKLMEIASKNTNIKVIYTLTKPGLSWKGEKGRISQKLLKQFLPNISEKVFLIAGSQKFVDDMNLLLITLGIPQENIRIDYFTGY